MNRLLAKSRRGPRELSLLQHLLDTEQAASALFRHGSRWAGSYLRFFRIAAERHDTFLLHLRLAALFHDVGKANESFQTAMVAKGYKAQSYRHEHLSALFMCHASIVAWLSTNPAIDIDVIIAAVLSHHLKASENGDWEVLAKQLATPTPLYFNDIQVREALLRIADVAKLGPISGTLPNVAYFHPQWADADASLRKRAALFASALRKNEDRLQLTLAIKAGLIASDSVASGMWREDHDIGRWIEDVAHAAPIGPNDVEEHILQPRQRELGVKWKGWHGFQTGAADIGRRGLLLAACGAGKTLAAWKWASTISRSEPIGRVIFLYPTRGSATEGFRDYVAHAPEGEGTLLHGTSSYELAGMLENPPESLRGKSVLPDEAEARLFALGLWNKRYFAATVDQFLGFIEQSYKGLCLLPALADSAIIFDEIHSYDARMWNALVTFLGRFDVPVLCMTATLPPGRRGELETCALRAYPSSTDMDQLADLEINETRHRYVLESTTQDGALQQAVAAYRSGQRVLWVVNTVRRCQAIARLLKLELGDVVGVYHSRFRLQDRQTRHRETIAAFRAPEHGGPPPAISVTTQVCEMSLDLDADVLISEHAPISSLVQRFGRANRHLRRGDAFRARLLTYPPEAPAPYDPADLEASAAFIAEFTGREVSQRDLAVGLAKHATLERLSRGSTSFIEGGFYAVAAHLRDSDDIGCPTILDADIIEYRRLRGSDEPVDGLQLTVPKRFAREPEPGANLAPFLRIARSDQYNTWLGFVGDDEAF